MDNPLVEHLKENGPDGGRKGLASAASVVTPGYWRRVALRVRQRPVARVCLGLLVAFACGVGLGVGVAAMIAPQEQHGRSVADASHDSTGIAPAAAGPVVAVTVREDSDTGSPSASAEAVSSTTVTPVVSKGPAAAAPEVTAAPESAAQEVEVPRVAYAVDLPEAPRQRLPVAPVIETPEAALVGPEPAKAVEQDVPEKAAGVQQSEAEKTEESALPRDAPAAAVAAPPNIELGPSLQAVKGPLVPAESTETVVVEREEPKSASAPTQLVDETQIEKSAEADAPVSFEGAESVSEVAASTVATLSTPSAPVERADTSNQPVSDGLQNGVETGTERDVVLPPRPARKNLQLAALPMPRTAPWIRNAVRLPEKSRDAMIAIIIDDMGIDQKRSKAIINLSAPLTLAFISYGYNLDKLTDAARVAGHEIMLHLPMEPLDPEANPGPKALMTTVSVEENRQRLLWALSRMDGIVGLNNHMGSKFTTWLPGMQMVMEEVAARGLLFVDSFTHNESVGFMLAQRGKLPSTARDVFIDHDIDTPAIERRLRELEKIARRRGYAIGIAHPHDLTREALQWWIVDAQARGFDFVPVSHIVRRGMKSG
ncbi:MAG: divergent polysaccharide deacetylase family protein [Pseudomonadota bacterium]